MAKVRPWYGHHDHIHVRLEMPGRFAECRAQPPVPGGDGCGAKELDYWFSDKVLHPKIGPPAKPPKPLMLADLPPACKTVLEAPDKNTKSGQRQALTIQRRTQNADVHRARQTPARSDADTLPVLRALERKVLWLASWTIHNANHLRENARRPESRRPSGIVAPRSPRS